MAHVYFACTMLLRCHSTGATWAQGCLGSAAVGLCLKDRARMAHVYVGATTMAL